jgi:hypothetical protein
LREHSAGFATRPPHTLLFHTLVNFSLMTPAQPSSPVLRFLLPSVRDLIFVFLFWSLLAGPLSNRPLADPDIGWHIRTGEQILATHTLPRTDSFSSTMQGQRWFAWEWLYDLLLGILHWLCGLNGVVWLCALLVAAIFAILLSQLLKRGTSLLLAVGLMLLAEAASTIHLYARPHIVSWLLTLLWFIVLEKWERWNAMHGSLPRWIPWFFPLSMLFWVNLHGGWLLGIALLGIYTFAAYMESLREQDSFAAVRARRRARAMAVAGLASAAATLVNPFGWRLYAHIYRYLGDRYLMNHIEEFRSPNFHGWAERSFVAILLLVVAAFAGQRISSVGTSADRGRIPLSHLLIVLLAVYAGFYSSRNLPISSMLLVMIAGPILWENFAALGVNPGSWRWVRNGAARVSNFSERMSVQEMQLRGHVWPMVAAVFGLAICLHGGEIGSRQLIHAQFDAKKVPVAAVDFLQKQDGAEPIFSNDAWGGYLIYRMYPQRKVVVDDRHDLYGSDRVRQLLILTQGEPGWRKVLAEWQIRTVLLPSGSTLANLLRELPQDWQITYEDRIAIVFERR